MKRLSQWRDDSGQTLVIAALCMTVLIAMIGLAVDVGSFRYEKRRLQNAADATALAAALQVRVCAGVLPCTAMTNAVTTAMTENGFTGATFISNCATPGTGLTVMLNNPVCLDSSDPHKSRYNYVETQISETAPAYFSRIFGYNGFPIKARSQAARGVGGPCLYALNPSASGSLNIAVGLGFQASCGVVVESSSPTAVNCLIGLGVTAPYVQLSPTGGGASLLCLGNTSTTQAKLPTPLDPLAYLPPPSTANDPCGTGLTGNTYNGSPSAVTVSLLANVTFKPGVYCGGITILAAVATNVTFKPGTYILRDNTVKVLGIPVTNGGLNITITALTAITGNGVTFYNEGNTTTPASSVGGFSVTAAAVAGLSQFALTAPTTGNYGGILFWQAPGVTTTGTFIAPGALTAQQFSGIIYEPSAMVSYTVNAISGGGSYNGIVADKLQFNVGVLSNFTNDYSTLQLGSPFNGDRSELVQ